MHALTILVDRVFDVAYQMNDDPGTTWFSIEFQGHKQYGLQLPGRVELRSGSMVTVVLDKEGNWQTLLALRDHASGATLFPWTGFRFLLPVFVTASVGLLLCAVALTLDAGPAAYGLIGVSTMAGLAYGVVKTGQRRAQIQALLDAAAQREAAMPSPPGGR